jgi:hypothetical protein
MSARKDVDVAKGLMYPSITAFGGIGTSYVNVKRPVIVLVLIKPLMLYNGWA